VTSSNVRNHNERAYLSMLRVAGPMAGSELSRRIGVSAQTVSVITRALEADSLIVKEAPVKGKVGKPQVPVALNPDGVFALGLRLGRRGADLILLDMLGTPRSVWTMNYLYPDPAGVEAFVEGALNEAAELLGPKLSQRITGIGVGAPYELWNWLDALGATAEQADAWREYSFETAFKRFTSLPVFVANDINMACNGELLFGTGATYSDFAYFYVGSFIGGGVVLNGQVFHGVRRNAGAFGSIPIGDVSDPDHQLIHHASVYRLETSLSETLGRTINLRRDESVWAEHEEAVSAWIADTAKALAKAAVAVCAVLDVPTIIIDGGMPIAVRARLIDAMRAEVEKVDQQGIDGFQIVEAKLGRDAGALGAGYEPILAAHFLEGSALS
jgi:predicted NBD/HSP70 family sugar kinase